MNLLITGASLPDGTRSDLAIAGGVFVEPGSLSKPTVIDGDGLQVLPGLVDLHTHLREPGFEQSETVLTGSRAAAAGGFTAVHAMANTSPVADTAGVVEQVASLGDQHGYVTVRPIGAVTLGLAGEHLAEIGAMARSRAAVRVFSDDGKCVHDALLMRRALEYVSTFDGVVAQHAQEPRLTEGAQMNEGALASELGLAGWPAVAEEAIIARDVLLAEAVGARLHVCHVSTAGSVEVVRWAKARGIAVTAEVTPHHLLLTEDLAAGYDARYKVNPPLRRSEDVEALRAALADGTIDIVATDHAPHPIESKEAAWAEASSGWSGSKAHSASCRPRWSTPDCSAGQTSRACCRPRRPRSDDSPATTRRSRSAPPHTSRSSIRPPAARLRWNTCGAAASTRRTSGSSCPAAWS
jgi:dihydroorotase